MTDLLKLYGITLVGFLVVDFVWIALVMRGFYTRYLGHVLADRPVLPAALAFYLLFVAGVLFFVVQPALAAGSGQRAALSGAFFGFVCYATYDLTNLATIKDWPWIVAAVDMAWGACVSAITSALGFAAGQWLGLGRP